MQKLDYIIGLHFASKKVVLTITKASSICSDLFEIVSFLTSPEFYASQSSLLPWTCLVKVLRLSREDLTHQEGWPKKVGKKNNSRMIREKIAFVWKA